MVFVGADHEVVGCVTLQYGFRVVNLRMGRHLRDCFDDVRQRCVCRDRVGDGVQSEIAGLIGLFLGGMRGEMERFGGVLL